jgi:hypothetical protein
MPEQHQQHDVDQLIGRLQGPEPTQHQAPVPQGYPQGRLILLAAAAVLLIAVGGIGGWRGHQHATMRGLEDPDAVLDLRMVVERGGVAVRVHEGSQYTVGERVFFRVAASRQAEVQLWVYGPGGMQRIAEAMAVPEAQDLGSGDTLLAWEFDQPGPYRFVLSQGQLSDCTPARCPDVTLEVR